jgi:hypothetical protein
MKKTLAILMGLWFVSAAGMTMADEASLQNDKQNLKSDVKEDQTGLNKADDKMGKDQDAIGARNHKVSDVKKDQENRYRQLLADRASLKDDKAKGDEKAVAADMDKLREDHHVLYLDQKELDKTRVKRENSIDALKDDRTHRDANVKQMDSNEQKLDKTNEKLADQKQDAATK